MGCDIDSGLNHLFMILWLILCFGIAAVFLLVDISDYKRAKRQAKKRKECFDQGFFRYTFMD